MKIKVFDVILLVFVFLFVALMIFCIVVDTLDRNDRDFAFEHSSGIVVSKSNGYGCEFNRVTVEISYKSVFGGVSTCEKIYLVSDDVFNAIELCAEYDGKNALGYVKQYRESFFGGFEDKLIFY